MEAIQISPERARLVARRQERTVARTQRAPRNAGVLADWAELALHRLLVMKRFENYSVEISGEIGDLWLTVRCRLVDSDSVPSRCMGLPVRVIVQDEKAIAY